MIMNLIMNFIFSILLLSTIVSLVGAIYLNYEEGTIRYNERRNKPLP